jgi:A/G-specific adenine glycosylase
MHPSERTVLRKSLLRWYDENQRDLPWRNVADPYAVWISEVMLQQTQVQTVIPYYLKFLKAFPNIAALANADTDLVLRLWAGLGYYSRARNLQAAARIIVERFGGAFPRDYADILALPGIGRYTAAAVASIAFGQGYAVVDGNVSRVLARLVGISGDPKSSAVQSRFWEAAQWLLPAARPGDFNQAVMELGATLCSPRQPQCSRCPWTRQCWARRQGRQELLPEKPRRAQAHKSHQAAVVVHHRGKYLIVRRSSQRLLKDFWEFPSVELGHGETARKRAARVASEACGLRIGSVEPLMKVKHSITTRRIELQVFQTEVEGGAKPEPNAPDRRWVRLKDLGQYAFASASQRILAELRKSAGAASESRLAPETSRTLPDRT